jgi:hypothetical protein
MVENEEKYLMKKGFKELFPFFLPEAIERYAETMYRLRVAETAALAPFSSTIAGLVPTELEYREHLKRFTIDQAFYPTDLAIIFAPLEAFILGLVGTYRRYNAMDDKEFKEKYESLRDELGGVLLKLKEEEEKVEDSEVV